MQGVSGLLVFVLVSFCFWMLQTLDESYQTEFKVPLRLKNVPKEVVLTSDFLVRYVYEWKTEGQFC